MQLLTLLVLLPLTISFQNDQSGLAKLRNLISDLDNKNPKIREESEEKIIELVKSAKKEHIQPLFDEIKKVVEKDHDPEVTGRLKEVLYIITQGDWFTIGKSPLISRQQHSYNAIGNKIIIWGGTNQALGSFNDGAIYDTKNDTWKKMKKSPLVERCKHTGVVIDNKLIIWGGLTHGGKPINNGAIYDIESDNWSSMKEYPLEAIGHNTSIVVGSKLFIWGGFYKTKTGIYRSSKSGAIYDIKKDKWTIIKQSTVYGRRYHSSVVYGKKVIIWGGQFRASGSLNNGAIYDIEKDSWTTIKKAPLKARWGHSAAVIRDKMIVWGGFTRASFNKKNKERDPANLNNGAIYDIKKDKWTMMSDCPIDGRSYHTGTLLNDKFIVWGGRFASPLGTFIKTFNNGAIYDIKSNSWLKVADARLEPRFLHTSIIINGNLIIWGGSTQQTYHTRSIIHFNNGAIYVPPVVWHMK